MSKTKSFNISKEVVWDAYKRVKSNNGSEGVDKQTIDEFEKNLRDNLYKIWNRMSSGSYFPSPVLRVEIPKPDGQKRFLGIPTVSDRVAQMVAKLYLEPELETHFLEDSYGYRPNKAAKDAVAKAKARCWRHDWVIDLDIKGFFDNIDHKLMMKAVARHTNSKWILLYTERWLKAPVQIADRTLLNRGKGTPQGGVISPLLANLFLHYAFDRWLKTNHPQNPFERYADDVIVHCHSQKEAVLLLEAISNRMLECNLELHPQKTKVVYCRDEDRREEYDKTSFDFLGFTFQPRGAKDRKGRIHLRFLPAISGKALKRIVSEIRGWKLLKVTSITIEEIARSINPIVRGWMNYYRSFYRSAFEPIIRALNYRIVKWLTWKHKKLHRRQKRAYKWLGRVRNKFPSLFAHWIVPIQA